MPGQHEELKRAIRTARLNAGITSDQELALRSGVHVQTIQNWMYGKTTPRPDQVSRVAAVLDVPMADLMAIYEGRQIQPPPLQDALRELVAAIYASVEESRLSRAAEEEATVALLQALGAAVRGVQAPRGTRRSSVREDAPDRPRSQ